MNPTAILQGFINPDKPQIGVTRFDNDETYRNAPGFSPSDLKRASIYFKEFGGKRGHPLKLLSDLNARQLKAEGGVIPPGYDEDKKETRAKKLGSVYHCLLLEPEEFDNRYAVVTPDLQNGLVELAKKRKMGEGPQKYSNRLGVAQEWKKQHGEFPEKPEIQQALLAQAQEAKAEGVKWHANLTEFTEWQEEQESQGKMVVWPNEIKTTRAMVEALKEEDYNRHVWEQFQDLDITEDRMEQSIFCAAEFKIGDDKFVVQLKGRPDCIPGSNKIIDPKTAFSCNHDDFNEAVIRCGYHMSMGGYVQMTGALANEPSLASWGFPKVEAGFLVQEKEPPFLAQIWWLPHDWLNWGCHLWRNSITDLLKTYRDNTWTHDQYDREFPDRKLGDPKYLAPPNWLSVINEIEAYERNDIIPKVIPF